MWYYFLKVCFPLRVMYHIREIRDYTRKFLFFCFNNISLHRSILLFVKIAYDFTNNYDTAFTNIV